MKIGTRAALLAAAVAAVTVAMFSAGGSASAQETGNPCNQLVGNGPQFEELGPAGEELRPLCALSIAKNVVADKMQVGGTISFNIVITNVGMLPLTSVVLADTYEETMLDFEGASIAPLVAAEEDEPLDKGGVMVWDELLPSPDLGIPGMWDAGESLVLTVTFEAQQSGVDENCATAGAEVPDSQIQPDDVDSCDSFEIVAPTPVPTNTQTSGGGGGSSTRRPTSTPTDAPGTPNTPVPVSTVAPATAVPVGTVVPVGISAPDTGSGDALGGGTGGASLAALLVAAVAGMAGAVTLRRSMR